MGSGAVWRSLLSSLLAAAGPLCCWCSMLSHCRGEQPRCRALRCSGLLFWLGRACPICLCLVSSAWTSAEREVVLGTRAGRCPG